MVKNFKIGSKGLPLGLGRNPGRAMIQKGAEGRVEGLIPKYGIFAASPKLELGEAPGPEGAKAVVEAFKVVKVRGRAVHNMGGGRAMDDVMEVLLVAPVTDRSLEAPEDWVVFLLFVLLRKPDLVVL